LVSWGRAGAGGAWIRKMAEDGVEREGGTSGEEFGRWFDKQKSLQPTVAQGTKCCVLGCSNQSSPVKQSALTPVIRCKIRNCITSLKLCQNHAPGFSQRYYDHLKRLFRKRGAL
jgi:hypothetical protein